MLSSFGSRITSMVTQPTTLAVAAGVLTGAIAGTALVSAGIPFARPSEPEKVALQACPGTGPVLAHIAGGRTMLVTARSQDGRWLELYLGEPGIDRAWAPASALSLQASADSLPVGGCEGVPLPTLPPETPHPTLPPDMTASPAPTITAVVSPSPGPTPKPGTSPSPTPKPTPTAKPTPTPLVTLPPTAPPTAPPTVPPTPTPTPVITPPPDLTPPSVTNLAITGAYYDGSSGYFIDNAGNTCGTPTSANINATVTDSGGSGLAGFTVHLHYWDPNGGLHDQQMPFNLGTHKYNLTINNNAGWNPGEILYWITASDNAGNTTTTSAPPDGSHHFYKGDCIL